jgi:hypothetical protein
MLYQIAQLGDNEDEPTYSSAGTEASALAVLL